MDFQRHWKDYFDQTYTEKTGFIARCALKYDEKARDLLSQISEISLFIPQGHYLDKGKMKELQAEVVALLETNREMIAEKARIFGNIITLQSSLPLIQKINKLIEEANEKIDQYNAGIDKPPEVTDITSIFWRYAVRLFEKAIKQYNEEKAKLDGDCRTIQERVEKLDSELRDIAEKGRELQKHRVSIRPTVDKINRVLRNFGFTNFSLQVVSGNDESHYQIVRADGTPAKETNFITFLYFYFSLDGTMSETSTLGEKVIVIDDPVSSLDSNVLYIVSTLINDICKYKIMKNSSGFTQLLLFTSQVHNPV